MDIDAHDPGDDPARNERYAAHLYRKVTALGLRPLLATWGAGGYHLWVLFDRDLPGPVLHAFGRWLVTDAGEFGFPAAPETFPKQPTVPDGKFGNWLRAPGRHHTRDVFARAWDGDRWADGEAAVARVLSLTGDPPDLLPAGAGVPKNGQKARAAGPKAAGKAKPPTAGPDVFAAYNSSV
ncbi:MAG: peptidase, partial [Isosphaera sp.]|nr:peptidase [Isosphaera sp.]